MFKSIQYIQASDSIISDINAFIDEWFNELTYLEVKTSGSTGNPTIIRLEKSKMEISARKTIDFLNIKENSSAFLCLSSSTIAGKMMIVRSIIGKLNLIVGPIDSNPLKTVNEAIDLIAMVPLQLKKTLESNPEKLRTIKSILIGGGPISDSLYSLIKKSKITIHHTFGMTETISHVAMRKIGLEEQQDFIALDGIHFSTENEQLVIHYPEIGIERLKTNDLVRLKSEKAFEWIARTDFIINSGGKKLNPEEIENAISSVIHDAYFIFGLEDEVLGNKVVLIIESKVPHKLTKVAFQNKLNKYAIPKEIFYLPSFIRTISGKINRNETVKLLQKDGLKEVL